MSEHELVQPAELAGVADLAERFDVFFIDQFGVLHDGRAPYPGAVETLHRLRGAGKITVLISNSGKRAAANEARLAALGFDTANWTLFLSSGEVAWSMLSEEGDGETRRCLLIARDGDTSAIDGLPLEQVRSGAEADIVLISASEGERVSLEEYRDLLEPAARRGAECLCTNPDKVMLIGEGATAFGAGRIAELYEELGGTVRWIGKPYPTIYGAALACIGNPLPEKVVCIGDSIEHDIAGGDGAGLATAFVRGGIHAGADDEALEAEYERCHARPDFILPEFRWT